MTIEVHDWATARKVIVFVAQPSNPRLERFYTELARAWRPLDPGGWVANGQAPWR